MGPYEAWGMVKAAIDGLGAAVSEFELSMHWQPQIMPERRGPGRPRKDAQAAAAPEERIVTSVSELMVPDDELEPVPAPPKRTRTRRRAAANGEAA
jgi:hypothetical protein